MAKTLGHLEQGLDAAANALDGLGAAWALVGGLAVSLRAEPRLTRDADLAVAASDDRQAEAVVFALTSQGFRMSQVLEHESSGRLATARLVAPGHGPVVLVDLLFHSSGIEPEIVKAAEPVRLWDHEVPVARTGHLVVLKLLARSPDRPQDAIDLVALRRVCTSDELRRAERAAELIQLRGCNRNRDLPSLIRDWWGVGTGA